MAYIILPSRRTRQPQGAVRVLSPVANPQVAWLGSSLLVNWVTGAGGTLLGGTPGVDISGRSINFPGGSTGGVSFPVTTQPQTKFTIIAVFRKRANFPYGSIYSFSGINSSVNFSENGASYVYGFNKGGVVGLNGIVLSDGIFVVVASLRQDTGEYYTLIKPFSGGSILRAAGTDTQVSTASDGAQVVGGGYALDGGISLLFSAFDFLPESNAVQYLYNPWQLFAPDPRRVYFGASGGGANIFESTFADSWSLSDTYSASATLVSTYADSPTVTDSSSSSAVFASAFDETIPVSDGPSADMGGVANRTQEESFTITDAYSASMVANATISETLSAEASASAAAIFNATFAETLPIVDGEEADAGRISDIAENVTVTDAYTAGIVAQATQAESVTTIDTYDTIAIYNPLLAETLPITDTVGATLTVPTSGTVDLSQESIDSLAHEIMVQLTSTPVRKL